MANPQKIRAEVIDIFSYGRQVYKLVFRTERSMPRFKAGQFLHLSLDDFDPTTGFWPESRIFSIAACSDDRKVVTIVYSVKGAYTKRMENSLSVGSSVWLKAPYGEFIISNHIQDNETVVLIAGGTGVSPFIPFLKQSDLFYKIQLNYGLRNIDLLIFKEELSAVLNHDNFFMNLYLEEVNEQLPLHGNLDVKKGILSIASILENIEDRDESIFFISGPPDMIDLFQKQLMHSGVEKEKIVIDEWG